jgi:hypothetical protein
LRLVPCKSQDQPVLNLLLISSMLAWIESEIGSLPRRSKRGGRSRSVGYGSAGERLQQIEPRPATASSAQLEPGGRARGRLRRRGLPLGHGIEPGSGGDDFGGIGWQLAAAAGVDRGGGGGGVLAGGRGTLDRD